MLVTAYDPGETTGFVIVRSGDWPPELVTSSVLTSPLHILDSFAIIKDSGTLTEGLVIIIEDFRLYAGYSRTMINNRFEPVKVIGQIELLANMAGISECLTYQMASCKTGFPNSLLTELGYQLKGVSIHERDALRHALYWTANHLGLSKRTQYKSE